MKPTWLAIAESYRGTAEIPGPKSNATIIAWATKLGGWIRSYFSNDDIPWCALFVNACLDAADLKGTGSLAARSFEKWGQPLTEPTYGAVLVFTRDGGGHVGFYVGERADAFRVLGGNQSNMVNETWISRRRLTAVRWPAAVPAPAVADRRRLGFDGQPVSTNEG